LSRDARAILARAVPHSRKSNEQVRAFVQNFSEDGTKRLSPEGNNRSEPLNGRFSIRFNAVKKRVFVKDH